MDILLNGILALPGWAIVVATLVLTHITIAGVTIFFHRHQAHSALTLHPLVSHCFRFWLWLTTGIVTREWVAIHRKHHAKCETAEDPHSPQIFGLKKLLWQGSELYRAEAKNQQTLERYGQGTPDDWLERNLYSRFHSSGITLMLLMDVLCFGVIGITVFAVQMLWIPFWAAGVINGVGHYFGYRNFEVKDASRNIIPWGIVIGGEELHNNHHAYPSSARLSNKWWELDMGWLYIRLMQLVGLAKVRKSAPRVHSEAGKQLVDLETVRALVRNRFHVIKLYGRKVIRPVLKQEYGRANTYCRLSFRRVRKLMIREDIQLDGRAQALINEVMLQSQAIATVYEFKQKLKALWENSKQNHMKRLEHLQIWCSEAEASGITALEDFAQFIRGYSELRTSAI